MKKKIIALAILSLVAIGITSLLAIISPYGDGFIERFLFVIFSYFCLAVMFFCIVVVNWAIDEVKK